jgi:SAM-dependent methyltransferase
MKRLEIEDIELKNKIMLLVQEQKIYSSYEKLSYRLSQLFKNIPIKEKRILEIGAGSGVASCFLGALGASKVIGLEPEGDGSSKGMAKIFQRIIKDLNLKNVYYSPLKFQEFKAQDRSFDIILLNDSINHLDEKACRYLHIKKNSCLIYLDLFRKMNLILDYGGYLVISDCARSNIFNIPAKLHLFKNPVAPTINWDIHQNPKIWIRLLKKAQFNKFEVDYYIPYKLRQFSRLLNNFIWAYFTTSMFIVRCRKNIYE